MIIAIFLTALLAAPGWSQQHVEITGDRLSGFVLPTTPRDGGIRIAALRAETWTVDDTKRLVLSGDVVVHIGSFRFIAEEAVVWINRLPTSEGVVSQIALFLPASDASRNGGAIGVGATNLLVTGAASGAVTLDVALRRQGSPASRQGLVAVAQRRLAQYLKTLVTTPPNLSPYPVVHAPTAENAGGGDASITLPASPPTSWIAPPGGRLLFAADRIDLATGSHENVITCQGNVAIDYATSESNGDLQSLRLTAQHVVVFLKPGPIDQTMSADAESIKGIYLEGNVMAQTHDDQYTIRAPQMYYDFTTGQAIMVEAVLRTFDRTSGAPIHARAQELRQVSQDQWTATEVRVSTSPFFTPHVSLGAEKITLTRREVEDPQGEPTGEYDLWLDSRNNILRLGHLPVAWWPHYEGRLQRPPLKQLRMGWGSYKGATVETGWDPYTLMGTESPANVDATLSLDAYMDRGVGVGLEAAYELYGAGRGGFDLALMHDSGTEQTSSGETLEVTDSVRGVALWEQTAKLGDRWTLQGQAAWISDPTYISSWRPNDFQNRRAYESDLFLGYQSDLSSFSVLADYSLNDFISNDWLLASRQYQVDRLGQLAVHAVGVPVSDWGLQWSTDTRAGRLRMVFQEGTLNSLGLRDGALTWPDGSPVDPDTPIRDVLAARGLVSNWVTRISSWHELSMQLKWGALNVVPFASGQWVTYSSDETQLSSDDSANRLSGTVGVTFSTQFHRIDDDVESRMFDLHRMRHIIEPSVTIWHGASDRDLASIPEYEWAVDGVGEGSALRLGLTNTWQTFRGGPGRWTSIDWLTMNVQAVFSSHDATSRYPTPQWFSWRPEYSTFGDFVSTNATLRLSDRVAVLGEMTRGLGGEDVTHRASIGVEIDHAPDLTTFMEYREINSGDSRLLDIGWKYRVSPRYEILVAPAWDFTTENLRSIRVEAQRSFPDFDLTLYAAYDRVRDETFIGASLGRLRY